MRSHEETTLVSGAATAGNVVYSYTIPEGRPQQLLFGQVLLTTDATVANRRVVVGMYDAAGTLIFDSHAGAVVTASLASQHMELMQGVYRETALVNGTLQIPIPLDWIFQPSYTIRVSVSAGVAGDSHSSKLVFAAR